MRDSELIYQAFDGKLVGIDKLKRHVCLVLSKMPEEIVDKITRDCWVIGSSEDAWAFTFDGNDLKDKHLIIVSDEVLGEEADQIQYTIAHEIGHVMLGHRNSVFEMQTKEEIARQEYEADQFAKKYTGSIGRDFDEPI